MAELAIVGARLVDGTGSTPRDDVTVVVRDGRITSVGHDPAPSGVEVLELGGATLMPGLVDAHVHLSSLPGVPEGLRAYGLVEASRALLANGITTVRDLGAYGDCLFVLREAIESGLCRGPRLVLCGQVISATCPGATSFPGMYREASGADAFRQAVREQVSTGADVVKVMATGALTVPSEDVRPSQLTSEEMEALVDESHRLGYRVAAHAEGGPGIQVSVAAGADTIEHGEEGHLVPGVLATMAARGIVLVPTLAVFDYVVSSDAFPAATRERARRLGESARLTVTAARREGVLLAMGVDAPPHGGNVAELLLLVDAGLTSLEAIAAATSIAAHACGIDAQVGTVEPGKLADLIIVDGDPVADPAILAEPSRLAMVLQAGRVVARRGRVEPPS